MSSVSSRPPRFFVALSIAAAIAVGVELVVAWQLKQSVDVLNYQMLAFFAAAYLFGRLRITPALGSFWSVIAGVVLLASALGQALVMIKGDDYYHFLALNFALGLGLIAFGFRQTLRAWKVLEILALLSVLDIPFSSAVLGPLHLNELGATLSSNFLLLAGYPAVARGDQVILPTGSVEVFGPCSAAVPMLYLLKLTLLVLLVFPSRFWQKLAIGTTAVGIALFFNAIRICVMAVLAAAGDQARFHYWHEGAGANLFSVLYAAAFCAGCALLLRIGKSEGPRDPVPTG